MNSFFVRCLFNVVVTVFFSILIVSCSKDIKEPKNTWSTLISNWNRVCSEQYDSNECTKYVLDKELNNEIWNREGVVPGFSLVSDLVSSDKSEYDNYVQNKNKVGILFCGTNEKICVAQVKIYNPTPSPQDGLLDAQLITSAGIFKSDKSYFLNSPINPKLFALQSFGFSIGESYEKLYSLGIYLNGKEISRIPLCRQEDTKFDGYSSTYINYDNCFRLHNYKYKNKWFAKLDNI